MKTPTFFLSFATAILLIVSVPAATFATEQVILATESYTGTFQEKGKETKKPVKEVPQSRKQEKPREVKPVSPKGKS